MFPSNLFKKPKNSLENPDTKQPGVPQAPAQAVTACPKCKTVLLQSELADNCFVCTKCGHHLRLGARKRISIIADDNSFSELFPDMMSKNILNFPSYDLKLSTGRTSSGESEAVVCGTMEISGMKTAVFAMDARFMMGSMGAVVGEKITRLFEYATDNSLPVIGFTLSGGARMQEGIYSLMQMAKTSAAVKYHSDSGNLYITVLTDPTSGGVTASFAMEGDIIIAEPNALICFAGPRVIEQTIRQKLPAGFQHAEFLQKKGFVDSVVSRKDQKSYITNLLKIHSKGNDTKVVGDSYESL